MFKRNNPDTISFILTKCAYNKQNDSYRIYECFFFLLKYLKSRCGGFLFPKNLS